MSSKERPRVFVRDATGLVRSLSGWDLFNLAFGQVMPAVGIVYIVSFAPFGFPQSNLLYAFLISIPLISFGPALIYAMLGAAMPRSGGDYVYVSRIIHPALGFMTSWLFTVTVLGFIALAGTAFPSTALNILVATIGEMTNNQYLITSSAWFTTQTGELVAGSILIMGISVLMAYGRAVWKFMKVLFFIVMVGTVVNIIYLATIPNSVFISAWNAQYASSGFAYDQVIQTAVKNGYMQGWTWPGTISVLVYAMGAMIGFNFSAYTAGEAKNASKTMPLSIVGSALIAGTLYMLWTYGIYHAFGSEFFSASNYLAACCASTVPLPIPVSVNSLFTVIPQNALVELLGALAFGLAWIWLTPTDFIPVVRNLFAWSFDRVGPTWLADVDEKYHSPLKAMIAVAVIGEMLMILTIYTSLAVVFANTTILENLAFLIASVAGIIFPFRAKDLFEQSPSWVKKRVAGVPVISLVGTFSAAVELIFLYGAVTNVYIGGAPVSYPLSVGITAAGLVFFYGSRAYRKRQGLDLDMAFRTLPPE